MEFDQPSAPPIAARPSPTILSSSHHPIPLPLPPNPRKTLIAPRHYLLIHISSTPPFPSLTPSTFRSLLTDALRSLLGLVGSGLIPLSVLSFDPSASLGLVVIDARHAVPFRAAMTLCGQTEGGRLCRLRVLRSSAFLPSLGADAAAWQRALVADAGG